MYGPLSKMVMVAKKAAPSVARAAVPRVAAPVVVGGAGGQWSIRAESTTPSTSGADWARPGVREGPIPAEFPEGSIFQREKEGDIFRQVYFDVDENDPNSEWQLCSGPSCALLGAAAAMPPTESTSLFLRAECERAKRKTALLQARSPPFRRSRALTSAMTQSTLSSVPW